jgi:hypothetical protein
MKDGADDVFDALNDDGGTGADDSGDDSSWFASIERRHIVGALAGAVSLAVLAAILWFFYAFYGLVGAVIIAASLAIGFIGPAAYVYLVAPAHGGSTALGRILFLVAQQCFGAGIMVQLPGSRYQMFAADRKADGTAEITISGETIEVEPHGGWSRLGWAPFGITWLIDEETLGELAVTPDDDRATADGGVVGTGVEHNGMVKVMDERVLQHLRAGGLVADIDRLMDQIGEQASGARLLKHVEDITLQTESADNGLEGLGMILGIVMGLMMGVAAGVLAL